ncbi:hypothetical protein PAMP_005334 [Pampus punctatissimus]
MNTGRQKSKHGPSVGRDGRQVKLLDRVRERDDGCGMVRRMADTDSYQSSNTTAEKNRIKHNNNNNSNNHLRRWETSPGGCFSPPYTTNHHHYNYYYYYCYYHNMGGLVNFHFHFFNLLRR